MKKRALQNQHYALLQAAAKGDKAMVLLYLGQGAPLEVRDEHGLTALHFASLEGHLDVVRALVRKGASVNVVAERADKKRNSLLTPLHMASSAGHVQVVAFLIEKKAHIHQQSADGMTALHYAESPEVILLLVAHGADIHAIDYLGRTPLHTAQNVAVARTLVGCGADLYAQDELGKTPLEYAQNNHQIELIEFFSSFL